MKVALLMDRPRWCKKSARNERLLWKAYLKEREVLEELAKRKRDRDEWLAQYKKRVEEYRRLFQQRKRKHENGIGGHREVDDTEKDYVMSSELLQQQFPEQQQQFPEANSSEIRSPKGAKAPKLG